MPSRGAVFAIFLVWLATAGWLFWTDLWPHWQPGQPPAYDIDIVDEVQRDHSPTFWEVRCDTPGEKPHPKNQYHASTHVEYQPRPNVFVLRCELQVQPSLPVEDRPTGVVRPNEVGSSGLNNYIVSTCSIDRAGRLRALSVQMTGKIDWQAPARIPPFDADFAALFPPSPSRKPERFLLDLSGAVQQQHLLLHAQVSSGPEKPILHAQTPSSQSQPEGPETMFTARTRHAGDGPALTVSHFGAVFMPLHPLHRIAGLRPGQRWSLPMIHPLQAALAALDPKTQVQPEMVQACVLPTRELIPWGNPGRDKRDRSCLILDYQAEGVTGSTWIEEDSGRVLRHHVNLWGQKWFFERRPAVAVKSEYST